MKTNVPSSRAQAAALLQAVLAERQTLDEALAARPLQGEGAQTRFTMMLVLTALRHLGQIDALLARYIAKPLPDKRVAAKNALRLGAVQLLLMNTPAHAALNETVQLVKESKDGGLSGLVNAVLQKLNKEKPALPDPIHNLPGWLRLRWEHAYGADVVAAMAAVAAERPPLDLVVPAPMQYAQGERMDTHVWRLPSDHESVAELEGYNDGKFWVQDIAATYPARLLSEVKGLSVLDIGAAPGGKTAQLAHAGAQVTALDKSATRMEVLKQNMARLRLEVGTQVADALTWEPGKHFDAVLLDAPCTATGTWRRHPEVLAVTTQHDITELARTQRELLRRAWHWVKPGGRLVYCVCSLEPEEGEQQAAWFAQHHSDAAIEKTSHADIPAEAFGPEGYLRTRPDMLRVRGGMDGFFAAVFRKQ
jgi:16S rRNA (cytosine967-C5)-methyltransferase